MKPQKRIHKRKHIRLIAFVVAFMMTFAMLPAYAEGETVVTKDDLAESPLGIVTPGLFLISNDSVLSGIAKEICLELEMKALEDGSDLLENLEIVLKAQAIEPSNAPVSLHKPIGTIENDMYTLIENLDGTITFKYLLPIGEVTGHPASDTFTTSFFAIFENYMTENESEIVVYISEIRATCGNVDLVYRPDTTELDTTKWTSGWEYGYSNKDFHVQVIAEAATDWRYVSDLLSSTTSVTIPSNAVGGVLDLTGQGFGFKVDATIDPLVPEKGIMNIEDACPAFILEYDPTKINIELADIISTGATIVDLTGGKVLIYWSNQTGEFSDSDQLWGEHTITINEVTGVADAFINSEITLTPVLYDLQDTTYQSYQTAAGGSDIGTVTAIDGSLDALDSCGVKTLLVSRVVPVADDASHPTDIQGGITKAFEDWNYTLSETDPPYENLGDADPLAPDYSTRHYVSNDSIFEKDGVHHGNRIWANLGFTFTGERDTLENVVLYEKAGVSYDTEQMNIIGFDVFDDIIKPTKIIVKYGTSGESEYTTPFSTIPVVFEAPITGVTEIQFVYDDVAKATIAGINPRVLFEVTEDVVVPASPNNNIPNTALLYYTPYTGGTGIGFNPVTTIIADIAADSPYKAKALIPFKQNAVAFGYNKSGVNKSDGTANAPWKPGDLIEYAIKIEYPADADATNINSVEIIDLMNNMLKPLIAPATATVYVSPDSAVPDGDTTGEPETNAPYAGLIKYTDVPLTLLTDEQVDEFHDSENTDASGFKLTLNGSFEQGDVIYVVYQTNIVNPIPAGATHAINKFGFWLYPEAGGSGGDPANPGTGGSTTLPTDPTSPGWVTGVPSAGFRSDAVTEPAVYASLTKTVSTGTTNIAKDPAGTSDDYTKYATDTAKTIKYTITASIPSGNRSLPGKYPVIADYLPADYDFAETPNVTITHKGTSATDKFNITLVRKTSAAQAYLIIKPTSANAITLSEGESLVVTFDVALPASLPSTTTGTSKTNYAFFDPNGYNSATGEEATKDSTGKFIVSTGTATKFNSLTSFANINEEIKLELTGYNNTTTPPIGSAIDAANRNILVASVVHKINVLNPQISIVKTAHTAAITGNATTDNASKVLQTNRLFAEDTVYYQTVIKNTGATVNTTTPATPLSFKTIVDYLPVGQNFEDGFDASKISLIGSSVPASGTYTVSVEDSVNKIGENDRSKIVITFDDPVVLTNGQSLSVRYPAIVTTNENELRALVSNASLVNTVAVYPLETEEKLTTATGGGTKKTYANGNDLDLEPLADDAPNNNYYVFTTALVYYDVQRIKPNITKINTAAIGSATENKQPYEVNGALGKLVPWRVTIGNNSGINVKEMKNFTLYDVLPTFAKIATQGSTELNLDTSIDAVIAEFNEKYTNFELAINEVNGTQTLTITPVVGYELAPGASVYFDLYVFFPASIANTDQTNNVYFVPSADDFFENSDVSAGNFQNGANAGLGIEQGRKYVSNLASCSFTASVSTRAFKTVTAKHVDNDSHEDVIETAYGNGSPRNILAERGGVADYTYTVTNNSTSSDAKFSNIAIIDMLPRPDDKYTMQDVQRGSVWSPILRPDSFVVKMGKDTLTQLTPAEYEVYLSTEDLDCYAIDQGSEGTINDWGTVVSGTWSQSATDDTRWTLLSNYEGDGADVKAFRIIVSKVLSQGDSVVVSWKMDVPDNSEESPMGTIAWNSAAYARWLQNNVRSIAEPAAVGIEVASEQNCKLELTKILENYFNTEQRVFQFQLQTAFEDSFPYEWVPFDFTQGGSVTTETAGARVSFVGDGVFTLTLPNAPLDEDDTSIFATAALTLPEGRYKIVEGIIDDDGCFIEVYENDNFEKFFVTTYDEGNDPYADEYEGVFIGTSTVGDDGVPVTITITNTAIYQLKTNLKLTIKKILLNFANTSRKTFDFELWKFTGEVINDSEVYEKVTDFTGIEIVGAERIASSNVIRLTMPENPSAEGSTQKDASFEIFGLIEGKYQIKEVGINSNIDHITMVTYSDNNPLFINNSDGIITVTNTATNPYNPPDPTPTPTPDPTPTPTPDPTPTPPEEPTPTPPGDEDPTPTPPGDEDPTPTPPDDDDPIIPPPPPGGNDPFIPPVPNVPTNALEPSEEDGNIWIEFDDEGTPLGEWRYDDDLGEWIFDEYPPLGALTPQTGDATMLLPIMFIAGAGIISVLVLTKKRTNRRAK